MAIELTRQVLRFVVAGAFGFAVELIVVGLLTDAGWSAISARAVSFPLASLLTWVLNRRLAFKDQCAAGPRSAFAEYRRYVSGQIIGASANLCVYTVLVIVNPSVPAAAALSIGAVFGMLVNYSLARVWIFRGQS